MTIVERMARAICEARGAKPDQCLHGYSWAAGELGRVQAGEVCWRRRWQEEVPLARVALTEMMEPTFAVKMAGAQAITAEHMKANANYDAACDAWQAMIQAALDEGEGG